MRKNEMIFTAAMILSFSCAFSAYAEWGQDDKGYWYKNDSGSYARDQVIAIDGVNYVFNAEGYMLTGWQSREGKWYYYDTGSGAQVYGWRQVDGKWYYLDPASGGAMHISWLKLGNNRYYMDANGVMMTGYFGVDGLAYEADSNGVVVRNQHKEDEHGNIFSYDDEGRIKFANNTTRQISKGEGGSSFQDFLPPEFFEEGKAMLQEQAGEVIARKKDELFVKYKKKLKGVTSSSRINRRREDWKKSVNRELGAFNVPQEEIDEYIRQVIYNYYQAYGDLNDYGYYEIDKNYEYEEDEDDDYEDEDDYYDYD
ncbi:MAG: hypothetical protein HFG54_03620 [Lachnospiraceae bacterium]|jgi:hypothetical protein|nr:hypothetical protein [Lachnospiraceae bacterium]